MSCIYVPFVVLAHYEPWFSVYGMHPVQRALFGLGLGGFGALGLGLRVWGKWLEMRSKDVRCFERGCHE